MGSSMKSSSYILAVLERGQIAEVVRAVRALPQVEEGALLIGRYDLLVRVAHYDRPGLYKVVSDIRSMPGIKSTSTHIPFEGFTKDYTVNENDALAISLLRCEGSLESVLTQLSDLEQVVEGHIIPGDWDLLVILHSSHMEHILEAAVSKFEGIHGVRKTETLIARQYFRRTLESTVSVGTFVPQYAFERLRDGTVLGARAEP